MAPHVHLSFRKLVFGDLNDEDGVEAVPCTGQVVEELETPDTATRILNDVNCNGCISWWNDTHPTGPMMSLVVALEDRGVRGQMSRGAMNEALAEALREDAESYEADREALDEQMRSM